MVVRGGGGLPSGGIRIWRCLRDVLGVLDCGLERGFVRSRLRASDLEVVASTPDGSTGRYYTVDEDGLAKP